MSDPIQGFCPMGCGQTLVLGDSGAVTCAATQCPRPTAAAEILADPETEHIVQFGATEFTTRHPLRERLDDTLMKCVLHKYISILADPPRTPGRYRARHRLNGGWDFEPLADDAAAIGPVAAHRG